MRLLLTLSILSAFAFANMHFAKNEECVACHPTISEEFEASQHNKSTIFKDPIHGAVYNAHPSKANDSYICGNCHTPTADNLDALVTSKNGTIPDPKNETQNEAISCAFCHRITDVTEGALMDKSITSDEEKVYFTRKENPQEVPFHGLKTNKAIFEDGKVCLGCHAHKGNKNAFQVCITDINPKASKKNCIECHMHKVEGAPSIMSEATEHTYHGFPGLHGDLTNLSQYVNLDITVEDDKKVFDVIVKHDSPHSSLLNPLRFSQLAVSIQRGDEIINMEPQQLFKMIGAKGKMAPPWLATEIIRDTRIPPNTKKTYTYAHKLKTGDIITAKFGYFLVPPHMLKNLKLEENEEAKKFRVISTKKFTIK